jgi:hypothetical protein
VFTGANQSVTVTAFYLGATQATTLTVIAKPKDTKEKEKDIKEKERFEDKFQDKIQKEEFEDKVRDSFEPRSVETPEPGAEESASERSFIQPEERPEPGQQVTEESDEEE